MDSEDQNKIDVGFEREVRFAVVMYGGVSLAIYINGVAQELLNMVRATAPETPSANKTLLGTLSGSEAVYRELALYLDEQETKSKQLKRASGKPILRTRFIVDVISGTSAGGINGVFLAKALARNQNMEGLKKLWLREGDLSKLLNDAYSVQDLSDFGFRVRKPEKSLLNSQRMYRKLLEALEEMGDKPDSEEASPLVGELDLFITTTDIEGLPLPISLADKVVYERRYKNVFHFRYDPVSAPEGSEGRRDDFRKKNDPFLAFAARCTSSFPFAFEPMSWGEIESVTRSYSRYSDTDVDSSEWDRFFSEYLRNSFYDIDKEARGQSGDGTMAGPENSVAEMFKKLSGWIGAESKEAVGVSKEEKERQEKLEAAKEKLRTAFRSRSFGDGGYLDNKPFSYATAMLMRRHSDYIVDRKLIYVEPSPNHPELIPQRPEPPDFAENVMAAVLELPRDETIREDLDRLFERNEMVSRVAGFAKHVDKDLTYLDPGKRPAKPKTGTEFAEADLKAMIDFYGISYGAYHRIRVEEVTNLISELAARAAGYDPSSDAVNAIRELVTAWRERNYVAVKEKTTPRPTENEFLSAFDLRYRMRRLFFLERRITELSHLGAAGEAGTRASDLFGIGTGSPLEQRASSDEWLQAFQNELAAIKHKVGERLKIARYAEESFLKRDPAIKIPATPQPTAPSQPANENAQQSEQETLRAFSQLISDLQLSWDELKEILGLEPGDRLKHAQRILDRSDKDLNLPRKLVRPRRDTLKYLAQAIRSGLGLEKIARLEIADENADKDVKEGNVAARICLDHFYDAFAHYDLVTYPVQYGTGSAEANIVDVFRISPEDATSLIDETATGEPRRKLAGRAVMSFGAFLDEGWRKNDMLWGRLDGAERLITAVLPPTAGAHDPHAAKRNELIERAQLAILAEEVGKDDVQAVSRILSNALARFEPSSAQEQKLRTLIATLGQGKYLSETMRSALQKCLETPEQVRDYYKSDFEVNRALDPADAMRLISRATTIVGKMLEDLANKYQFDQGKGVARWIARFGSWFWNILAVAVPGSLLSLFFRHWLAVLYVFDLLMILGGTFIGMPDVKAFGWKAFGLTLALNLVVSGLSHYIANRQGWWRLVRILVGLVLISLIAAGAVHLNQYRLHVSPRIEQIVVASIAAVGACFILFMEWNRWRKSVLSAFTVTFNYPALALLTGLTLFLAGILYQLGPGHMVAFEFARTTDTASQFMEQAGSVEKLRRQLAIDYLFIIAYAATFATYCITAAKFFLQGRMRTAQTFREKQSTKEWQNLPAKNRAAEEDKNRSTMRAWYLVAVIGFVLAALQWIAGLADATENTGLLWFLRDRTKSLGLEIAFWSATVKFSLLGLGAIYSAIGFIFGVESLPKKRQGEEAALSKQRTAQQWLLGTLALISLIVIFSSAWSIFVCRPHPLKCIPPVSS